ncbi:DoxX family membrane protein [Kitasatospora sp. NA04385]|uniref:DoxX family protein n=1 Tax=Kitasatospora sp. NA04385 TaxID=2742135 RepID=UPI001591A483|nr:DoxX family membrane protein [Kitasatospora sp. NA04385]QKW23540.1 DoxX family membrane protein [Kitasatospora sp. NA04385]
MSEELSRLAERARPTVLGLARIAVSLLFACHGAAALFGVLGGAHGKAPQVGEWPGWWAALIQLVGGVLVLVGLAVRPAALVCSGSMAYAYFSVHQEHALWPIQNGGEPAAMFCWAFLLIAAAGPGGLALGGLLRRPRQVARPSVA